ncbi:MAG: fibronectin type III domain-containing protein [Chloroflexota bacterium]
MSRFRVPPFVVALAVAAFLVAGLVPRANAVDPADPSDVAIVLDFSSSILRDKANRSRFAATLDNMAARVDQISADLVAGDSTVSLIQFAARAIDVRGCVDLKLKGDAKAVGQFADCLRSVATTYRKGGSAALIARIGIDTNYVAAMEQAAKHLPADSIRPSMILFTDGKHDVAGVPLSRVKATRDRLFGGRQRFALLPVGMGLQPNERGALEAGLVDLKMIKDIPPCVTGETFDWPNVVFATPTEAGNAVGVALQDVTCTFTVAPPPSTRPSPTPAPATVSDVSAIPGDAKVTLTWSPVRGPIDVTDYRARCRAPGGEWVESSEGVSLSTSATISGLTNGTGYQCEVAAVGKGDPAWASAGTVTPFGRPAPPGKPSVNALDGGVRIRLPQSTAAEIDEYRFECSGDGDGSPTATLVPTNVAEIGGLRNGQTYSCRAFAGNPSGFSDASPVSDAFRPCGSPLECNPLLQPILALLGLILLLGVFATVWVLLRGRTDEYVVAVVDVIHSANLGHGSKLGIKFQRTSAYGSVIGIVPDRSSEADVQIRYQGKGRFVVRDRGNKIKAMAGESVVVKDDRGVPHQIVLRAFDTPTAAAARSRA